MSRIANDFLAGKDLSIQPCRDSLAGMARFGSSCRDSLAREENLAIHGEKR
jgi:hypothetical protein